MSSTTPPAAGPTVEDADDAELAREAAVEERHTHPSDAQYIAITVGLAVLTAIEVALSYRKGGGLNTVALLVLMAIKFGTVVGFFMHLRFDSKVFRRLFSIGLVLAVSVYSAVLFTLGIFHV